MRRDLSSVPLSLAILLPLHACAQRELETLAEVARHERVDDGIDAAVEVGHAGERLAHGFQRAVVEPVENPERHQDVVNHDGGPAHGEQDYYGHQHLDHLREGQNNDENEACIMKVVPCGPAIRAIRSRQK